MLNKSAFSTLMTTWVAVPSLVLFCLLVRPEHKSAPLITPSWWLPGFFVIQPILVAARLLRSQQMATATKSAARGLSTRRTSR